MAGRFFGTRENLREPPVDVLFYDEAGQLSPEQGAPIAALGKKLVSIGDTAQLEPYSSIPPHVDEARMIDAGLIKKNDQSAFERILKRGLSASSNSFMELAISACNREDGAIIGGDLLEHRRSVPEIISYCNELSYRGRLNPERPSLKKRVLPPFLLVEVRGECARLGVSLKNRVEARAIASWLKENEGKIRQFYSNKKIENILAIITPFSAQVDELKKLLSSKYPDLTIGTIHSLQGAERDIVLFSSVYDEHQKGENALDRDSRILNVSVSRARDSFIVFGAKASFTAKSSEISPSTLLGKYLFSYTGGELSNADEDEVPFIFQKTKRIEISTLEEHQDILKASFMIAKKRVVIVSPTISVHAIMHDKLSEIIKKVVSRGVEVLIFTDEDLDLVNGELKPPAIEGRQVLIESGAQVMVCQQIHNKLISVDDELLVTGSFNWLSAVRRSGSRYQKFETSSYTFGKDYASEIISKYTSELYKRVVKVYEA
jgi:hypothetical protein